MMLDTLRKFALTTSIILFILLVALLFLFNSGAWDKLGLPRASGSVELTDFSQITDTPGEKGFLACNAATCPLAMPDRQPNTFPVNAMRLRKTLVDYVESAPLLHIQQMDLMTDQFEITARHRSKTFPDLVSVKIIPVSDFESALVIYSRAIVGDPTQDLDEKRIKKWEQDLLFRMRGN